MPRFPSTYRLANRWLPLLLLSWPLVQPVVAHGEGQPAEETAKIAAAAEPADDSALTLKVLDPNGETVQGAQVGWFARWEGRDLDNPRIAGFGESNAANETDADGVVKIAETDLKRRMYDDALAVLALDKDNKLIGLTTVTEKDLGTTKEIHLAPGIPVAVNMTSTELEKLGHASDWHACYIFAGEERPFLSASMGGQLGFLLPPGEYKYNAYGSSLVRSMGGEIEISPNKPSIALEFDLPASNLGRLIGQPAPELDGVAHWKNSKPLKLADLRGKVVVLEFWGYWCGPCVHSMPQLVELYEEFKDQGLEVIAVHDDSVESVAELVEKTASAKAELWDGKDLPFPIAIDGEVTERMPDSERTYRGQTVGKYGIRSWPTAILIDREGTVVGEFEYRGPEGRKSLLTALGLEESANAEAGNETPQPPETEKKPVTDTYHGTKVTEDYRWLEDWSDPQVVAWSDAQNGYARSILDKLPNREAIAERIAEIMSAELVSYYAVEHAGGKFFAMKEQPPKQQPFLVVSDSLDDLSGERVLFDPNAADETGGAAIVWYKPSFDGKLVAVCIAHGGAEVGDVTVYDVETGKQVGEIIPRVNTGTAGGDLAWAP
ncbi:MAG TPA: redoxin domain-containing protein, partial [Lacipirellula sp.]